MIAQAFVIMTDHDRIDDAQGHRPSDPIFQKSKGEERVGGESNCAMLWDRWFVASISGPIKIAKIPKKRRRTTIFSGEIVLVDKRL
jgi:hypothetical protein